MSHGGGEGDGGSERWLVSYADFITLLMVLFVVLYSMGQIDVEKYKQLAESLRAAFSLGGAVRIVDPTINQGGGKNPDGSPNPIIIPGIPRKPPESQEVAGQLTQLLSQYNMGREVSVQNNIEGVLISLSQQLLFTPGTAELQPTAYPVLDVIAQMLKPIDNNIRIVGHTDNSPPLDPRYTNNWELSIARAMVIANYLLNAGIDPKRITVAGRGEFQPIFPNDTPEHRALNSRADIIIIYRVESNIITPLLGSETGLSSSSGN
ncbi:OmpA family protein [Thermanaerothrix daxensis]|uniref:OmpA family protein n=1 Tax=Thermanaerothrix daxensis TaxID=869279 RepID=UPI0006C91970|nr:OmpA family protein [Thermanaerothrix daxensis]